MENNSPIEDHNIKQFFKTAGVLDLLEGRDLKQLYQLCCVHQAIDDDDASIDSNVTSDLVSEREAPRLRRSEDGVRVSKYRLLEPMITHYFANVNTSIKSCDFFLLDRLGGRGETAGSGITAYRSLQTNQAVKEYSALFTRLVVLLINLSVQGKEALTKLGVTLADNLQAQVHVPLIKFT